MCCQGTLHQLYTSNTTSTTSSPVLLSSALSFIKTYRLKGDNDSLKRRVCDLFSSEEVDHVKTLSWNHCMQDLEAAGRQYHARRASDKRSQITANLDDIVQAFNCLDSADLVSSIYCEALDLLRIPSLNLEPILEKIESNTHSLHNLVSKIERLETYFSSCLETAGSNVKQLNTYADVTSSFIPLPPVSALSSSNSYSRVVPKCTLSFEHRECNFILFGLPDHGSLVETKASVDEILEFLVGRSIQVKDLFRHGKYVHPKDFEDSR